MGQQLPVSPNSASVRARDVLGDLKLAIRRAVAAWCQARNRSRAELCDLLSSLAGRELTIHDLAHWMEDDDRRRPPIEILPALALALDAPELLHALARPMGRAVVSSSDAAAIPLGRQLRALVAAAQAEAS